jgi:hypothetical protein
MRKILFSLAVVFLVVILQGSTIAKSDDYQISDTIKLSYKKDIVPIMRTSCAPCHFPPDGRVEPLDTYEAVQNNIADVLERIKLPKDHRKFMPYQSKKPVVSDSLIVVMETWLKQNMPE